jgi:hypothetical protein
MWSPFNQNLIITGSVDFTLRIWSISNQNVLIAPPVSKTSTKNRQRTKKKKTSAKNYFKNEIEPQLEKIDDQSKISLENEAKQVAKPLQNVKEAVNGSYNVSKLLIKKKPKKITRFPRYAEISTCNKTWCSSIRNLLESLKINDCHSEDALNCNRMENISCVEDEKLNLNNNNYILLGTKKNLEDSLKQESKKHV